LLARYAGFDHSAFSKSSHQNIMHYYLQMLLFLSGVSSLSAMEQFNLQGHRGARGLAPENTIPAFLKAIDCGVTTLELDVVVTADSQIVVSHEPWMSEVICRYPDGREVEPGSMLRTNIYQMTYEEVQSYDCGTRVHPKFPEQMLSPEYKPLLKEVFKEINDYLESKQLPQVFFNIETKSLPEGDGIFHPDPATFSRLLYDLLVQEDMEYKVTIQSFDVRTLQEIRKLDSELILVLLVDNDLGLQENLRRLGFPPQVYSPHFRLVDETLVEEVHRMGMHLIPWTVNEVEDIRRMIDAKVDGLITDYPNRAAEILKQ
jgi:glycerophosphoryl diester phosphodiesterase